MPTISQVEMVPIRKLRPNSRNARTHSKKQIGQIAESIERFGWTHPILCDEQKAILGGFGRFKATESLGLREVPVIVVSGLNETEKRALALADNKLAENAGWDREILAAELGELSALLAECNLDLSITGFDNPVVDGLLSDLVDREDDPGDQVPAIAEEAVSSIGDKWHLGPHRLRCGDATNEGDIRNLMGRRLAILVFTDPPYNVRISSVQGRGKRSPKSRHRSSSPRRPKLRFLRRSISPSCPTAPGQGPAAVQAPTRQLLSSPRL